MHSCVLLHAGLAAAVLAVALPASSSAAESTVRLFAAHALALRTDGLAGEGAAAEVLAAMPGAAAGVSPAALWRPFFANAVVQLGRAPSPAPVALYYNPLLDVAVITLWEKQDGGYRVAWARALPGERLADPEAAVAPLPSWTAADGPVDALARATAARLDAFRNAHPARSAEPGRDAAAFAVAAADMRAALPRLITATPLAVATLALTCAMPAEAGWLARGAGVAGAGYALKENLGDLVDRFGETTDAAFSGDSAKAADVWAKVKGTPGRIIEDAFPVLKLGDAALAAKARVKDRLESAERKVGRFVRRTGEAAADVRAALAVGKRERDWYESGTGVLAKEPLPVAVVSGARTAPAPQAKADPWGAAPTAATARSPDPGGATGGGAAVGRVWNAQGTGSVALPSDWRDRQDPWGAAPTAAAARSPDPGGVTGGGAAVGYVWNAEGTGVVALPSDWREPKGTATAAADPDDAYAAALDAALGDDPTTGSGDYRAALGALETREAERQEAERVAAARREAERQRRRDAEDARRRQEQFVNSIRQTVNTMQQTLQGSGTSQPSGRGSSYDRDCIVRRDGREYLSCGSR